MCKYPLLIMAVFLPFLLLASNLSVEVSCPLPNNGFGSKDLSELGYGAISEAGARQLPVKTVQVLLPYGAKVVSWSALSSAPEIIKGKAPGRNSGFFDGERYLGSSGEKEMQSRSVYLGMKKWGDLNYASFSLLPATWDGQNWLWNRSFSLEISYEQSKAQKGTAPPIFTRQDFFVNQNSLLNWYEKSKSRETEVLVIGTQALFNALSAWTDFRNTQGITVSFTDIAAALSSGVETDDASKLRNYLQTRYSQDPFSYLLILGDQNTVPVAYVTPEPNGVDTVPTDFFYGDLSSNWDSDNDERLGEYSTGNQDQDFEVDFTPEVYVGRISTNNVTQVTAIANRIVAYEQSSGSWKNKNLLPAAFLNYISEPELNMPETDGGLFMEFLRNTCLAEGENFTLYEQDGVVPSFPSDLPISYENFRTKLNSESWGFINWSAHGSSSSSSRKVWMNDYNQNNLPDSDEMEWQNLVTRQSFDNLSDQNGTVIFAASCYNGMIDADNACLGEYSLIKKAVGVLAATRTGWYKVGWLNPGWGGLSSYNYHFVENFRQTETTLGAAHAYANLLHTQYYLFGDPIDSGGIIWPELQNVYTYLLYGDPLVGYNPEPIVPQGEILVWEPVGNDGLPVVNAIRELTNMNVIYSDKLIVDYNYLNNFEAVFCLFNMPSDGTPIVQDSTFEYNYLLDYLNQGGKLYLEGYVDWNSPSELWQRLGTIAPYSGITNVSTIRHIPSGMLWSYTAPEMYISMLEPDSVSALPLFKNQNGQPFEPNIAIWNTNGDYRTVSASFHLSKVGDTEHSLTEMVGVILDTLGVTSYQPVANDDPAQTPPVLALSLYPNPAAGLVNFKFELFQSEQFKIEVFNLKGQRVYSHTNTASKGVQNLSWNLMDNNGNKVGSGVYLCRIMNGGKQQTGKLVVLR